MHVQRKRGGMRVRAFLTTLASGRTLGGGLELADEKDAAQNGLDRSEGKPQDRPVGGLCDPHTEPDLSAKRSS
jgi:hypothetical protein